MEIHLVSTFLESLSALGFMGYPILFVLNVFLNAYKNIDRKFKITLEIDAPKKKKTKYVAKHNACVN
jgi:hypothetical protein